MPTYTIRELTHRLSWQLPGWEILEDKEYLTTAQTKEHAENFVEELKKALPNGTQVRTRSGFIGEVIGLELDYHTGEIQYKISPDRFTQHDGKKYTVSWWGSSLGGTKPIDKLFGKEALP